MNIDFYVLENANAQQSLLFACELIEKAYQNNDSVFIHTSSQQEAENIDRLLWTYRDDSFIPHNLYDASDPFPPLVQIGFENNFSQQRTILINLCKTIPPFYQQFQRIIEIVFSDSTMQQLARERFKQYREQNYQIETHKITPPSRVKA